jgi:hypothetical protein
VTIAAQLTLGFWLSASAGCLDARAPPMVAALAQLPSRQSSDVDDGFVRDSKLLLAGQSRWLAMPR